MEQGSASMLNDSAQQWFLLLSLSRQKIKNIYTILIINQFTRMTLHPPSYPQSSFLCHIGRGGSVADRLMDPSSETTYAK